MGAEVAVHGSQSPGPVPLIHFADKVLVKIELDIGAWVIMGRVVLYNTDSDLQLMTAQILHDANVVLDNVTIYALGDSRLCVALQTTLKLRKTEPITLSCNTYKGHAELGSLIAFKVDDVVP